MWEDSSLAFVVYYVTFTSQQFESRSFSSHLFFSMSVLVKRLRPDSSSLDQIISDSPLFLALKVFSESKGGFSTGYINQTNSLPSLISFVFPCECWDHVLEMIENIAPPGVKQQKSRLNSNPKNETDPTKLGPAPKRYFAEFVRGGSSNYPPCRRNERYCCVREWSNRHHGMKMSEKENHSIQSCNFFVIRREFTSNHVALTFEIEEYFPEHSCPMSDVHRVPLTVAQKRLLFHQFRICLSLPYRHLVRIYCRFLEKSLPLMGHIKLWFIPKLKLYALVFPLG